MAANVLKGPVWNVGTTGTVWSNATWIRGVVVVDSGTGTASVSLQDTATATEIWRATGVASGGMQDIEGVRVYCPEGLSATVVTGTAAVFVYH